MFWRPHDGSVVLVDWEMVGLGSGPQDCGQFLISHMEPAARRACEERLTRQYHHALEAGRQAAHDARRGRGDDGGSGTAGSPLEPYTWESCWSDYVSGGSERWVWLLAVLASSCPPPVTQYFADQLASFLVDHGITPENIGMPRV